MEPQSWGVRSYVPIIGKGSFCPPSYHPINPYSIGEGSNTFPSAPADLIQHYPSNSSIFYVAQRLRNNIFTVFMLSSFYTRMRRTIHPLPNRANLNHLSSTIANQFQRVLTTITNTTKIVTLTLYRIQQVTLLPVAPH